MQFRDVCGYFYKVFSSFKVLGGCKKSSINLIVSFSYKNSIKAGNILLKTAIFKILDQEVDSSPNIDLDGKNLTNSDLLLANNISDQDLFIEIQKEIKAYYLCKNKLKGRVRKNVTK